MPISSNSLIHFTNSKERLKSILIENFKLGYCKEKTIIGGKDTFAYVPMVSFCDIPLSQIKEHISKYGDYGIGLTREWAIRNKLNPVLYIEQNSFFSERFMTAANYFLSKAQTEHSTALKDDVYFDALMALGDMRSYFKNYQANLERKNEKISDYRFADEREWRFVPLSTDNKTIIMSDEIYNSEDGKSRAQNLINSFRLKFEPNDIKYVIIKYDSEIHEFIEHLRKAKNKNYSTEDVDRLTTRILTSEQIKEDI